MINMLAFLGSLKISVKGSSIERFLNVCIRNEIRLSNISKVDETCLHATILIHDFRRLQKYMGRTGCHVKIIKKNGLCFFLYRFRRRYALILGAILVLMLYFALSSCIWVIDITAQSGISLSLLRQTLYESGAYIGIPISKVDETNIAQTVRRKMSDTVGYITVSRIGNRIIVEAFTADHPPDMIDDKAVTGIVANHDGFIVDMNVKSGNPLVKIGDSVVLGEQLVSAYTPPTTEQGIGHIGHSIATVTASTKRSETSIFPLEHFEKEYTGKTKTQYAIILGDFRINLYLGTGISAFEWDKNVSVSQLHIGEGTYFPIRIVKQEYTEYTLKKVTASQDELKQTMLENAENRLLNVMKDGKIDELSSSFEEKNGALILYINAKCTENIAEEFSEEGITLPQKEEKTEETS